MTRFAADDGRMLAYDDRGRGTPLLCLAGLTRNMDDFEPVLDAFADRARVIRLDTRGRGGSDRDPDFMNYNLIRESRDALNLMDHLGLDRVAILGTSRGGLIAMMLAASHKDRLSGVCLNDIGPLVEPRGMANIMSYLGLPPGYADYDDAAAQLALKMRDRFPGVGRDQWRAYARRLWDATPDGLALRYDPALRHAVMEQSATDALPDLWPLFDALDGLPLALIRGAHSDILSPETASEMQRRRPDMIFAEIPDRGHPPFLDEPAAVAAIATLLERIA
ncbi:alpha/beta hydrolase [Rhodovulum sulfidophilum]|uniref:alpha/beta fold hydrolase n=1 Tax=Rhodovulum sulfidophilum TaxID=35806 RepID=UPI001920C5C9|nr:alpha/beta hydrolase [Rhodovulum sulfidophilum]MBL3573236.1 alpha/beta hydrolase [Rhodovulum sulfidophilum]MCE8430877.1 alpha/beta hydrolase [Rhodovulum sulfidophilum]MCF4115850.1 alpha/beta hydrolase [Rhodovulum sulfidophilum]